MHSMFSENIWGLQVTTIGGTLRLLLITQSKMTTFRSVATSTQLKVPLEEKKNLKKPEFASAFTFPFC